MSTDVYQQFLKNELAEIDSFFKEHHQLVEYFFSGETHLDDVLFVRNSRLTILFHFGSVLDTSLSAGSYLLAWCTAYQQYRIAIEQVLSGDTDSRVGDVYEWNCTDADAAELIKALFNRKAITVNGNPANVKQLNEFFKLYLRRHINNVYDRIRINEKRKKDRNPFLRSLIIRVEEDSHNGGWKNVNKK